MLAELQLLAERFTEETVFVRSSCPARFALPADEPPVDDSDDDLGPGWVDLGADMISIILQRAGLRASGAMASVSKALYQYTMEDTSLWHHHLSQLRESCSDNPELTGSAHCGNGQCWASCRDIVQYRAACVWQTRLGACRAALTASQATFRNRLADANSRLSRLSNPDYRDALQLSSRTAPPELVLAARLLRAVVVSGFDAQGAGAARDTRGHTEEQQQQQQQQQEEEEEEEGALAVAWLQARLPQIAKLNKAVLAQDEIARFLGEFHTMQAAAPPVMRRVARAFRPSSLLHSVCLKHLDDLMGLTFRTSGRASTQAAALVVASAIIRWVAALVGGALLDEQEPLLDTLSGAVGWETERARARLCGDSSQPQVDDDAREQGSGGGQERETVRRLLDQMDVK